MDERSPIIWKNIRYNNVNFNIRDKYPSENEINELEFTLLYWSYGGDRTVNDCLRLGKCDKYINRHISNMYRIFDAIESIEDTVTLFRGISVSIENIMNSMKIGEYFKYDQFVSTTVSLEISLAFSHGSLIVYKTRYGTKLFALGRSEFEILLCVGQICRLRNISNIKIADREYKIFHVELYESEYPSPMLELTKIPSDYICKYRMMIMYEPKGFIYIDSDYVKDYVGNNPGDFITVANKFVTEHNTDEFVNDGYSKFITFGNDSVEKTIFWRQYDISIFERLYEGHDIIYNRSFWVGDPGTEMSERRAKSTPTSIHKCMSDLYEDMITMRYIGGNVDDILSTNNIYYKYANLQSITQTENEEISWYGSVRGISDITFDDNIQFRSYLSDPRIIRQLEDKLRFEN